MEKYGQAALEAVKYVHVDCVNPKQAWKLATKAVFPDSESLREKGCPRSTFLALCAKGLIVGVPPGNYTKSTENKEYAMRAVKLLKAEPSLAESSPKALWERVLDGREEVVHNSQMHVVLALWREKLLQGGPECSHAEVTDCIPAD